MCSAGQGSAGPCCAHCCLSAEPAPSRLGKWLGPYDSRAHGGGRPASLGQRLWGTGAELTWACLEGLGGLGAQVSCHAGPGGRTSLPFCRRCRCSGHIIRRPVKQEMCFGCESFPLIIRNDTYFYSLLLGRHHAKCILFTF